MTTSQLTSHLARTLSDDRLRSAAHRHVVRSAARPAGAAGRATHDRPASLSGEGLEQIVRAAAAGDDHAWTLLQDRFTKRIRAVARGYRLAPQDVDDVAQTTWLRLLEHIGAVRDANAVGAWLETTARRESLL